MTTDLALLGVGAGIIQDPESPFAAQPEVRDSRLLKEAALEQNEKIVAYSQTVDLANVNAGTTANVTFTVTTVDKVRAGDYVMFAGGSSLEHGIVIVGFPAPANDTVQLRVTNTTAGAINPASQTLHFLIFRDV